MEEEEDQEFTTELHGVLLSFGQLHGVTRRRKKREENPAQSTQRTRRKRRERGERKRAARNGRAASIHHKNHEEFDRPGNLSLPPSCP